MRVLVQSEPFDATALLDGFGAGAGAVVTFTGLVRGDGGLTALDIEHYPGMTERALVDLADLVIVAAHSGVGFGHGLVPRCTTAPRVWSLLAGAVAAMTGEDVPRALAAPDPSSLTGLGRSAREAVRDVVTCVAVPGDGAARVAAALEPTSSVDP